MMDWKDASLRAILLAMTALVGVYVWEEATSSKSSHRWSFQPGQLVCSKQICSCSIVGHLGRPIYVKRLMREPLWETVQLTREVYTPPVEQDVIVYVPLRERVIDDDEQEGQPKQPSSFVPPVRQESTLARWRRVAVNGLKG